MDYMLIDLTEISKFMEIRPGEPVVLIGQQEQGFIGLEEWAQMSQTISYEILTGLGPRLPRHYVW
jgi:alanine racemase